MSGLKLSMYNVFSDGFVDPYDGAAKRIVFNTRSGHIAALPDRIGALLLEGAFSEIEEALVDDLIHRNVIVPAAEDGLSELLRDNRRAIDEDDTLYLVIQPTAACQLGCGYCGQRHSAKLLSAEDQSRYVEHVDASLSAGSFRELAINWFGGEPLMGLPVIRSLTPELKRLADRHRCAYKARMVTNGLQLNDGIMTELDAKLGVGHVEVTLDGAREFHDRRRHRKDGSPSFDAILRNILAFARRDDVGTTMSLRCNVDTRNRDGVLPLIETLAAHGIQHRIDTFYVAPVHAWGNDADESSAGPEEFAAWEIEWLIALMRHGFRTTLIPSRKRVTCMAVRPAASVIDAYGKLYNCTEVSYVPAYEVAGNSGGPNLYSIGDIESGIDERRRDLLGGFLDSVERGAFPCARCNMLPTCGGGCPKLWLESKVPCPTPKFNIKARLVLYHCIQEGLKRSGVAASTGAS